MMRPDFIKFKAIFECQSLSKAADKLDSLQGGLSKMLGQLENELGYSLFIRTNRGLIPTENGNQLYRHICQQLKSWNDFRDNLTLAEKAITGELKIGGHSVVLSQFTKQLSNMKQDHTLLMLDFDLCRSPVATRKVLNHEIDIAICVNPQRFPELVFRKIHTEYVKLYSTGKKKNTMIVYNPELISLQQNLKKIPFQNFEAVAIPDYEMVAEFAKQSNALAILPDSMARKYNLTEVDNKVFLKADIYLAYRADHKNDKKLQAAIKYFSAT